MAYKEIQASRVEGDNGHWTIIASVPGGITKDITFVRNVPVLVNEMSFSDPFGPQAASISIPSITPFDARYVNQGGDPELEWCDLNTNIDIIWNGPLPYNYWSFLNGAQHSKHSWEGYIVSIEFTPNGLEIQCSGAMMQLDNYMAKPEYLNRPMPYEYAIKRQFVREERQDLRLKPLIIEFPDELSTYQVETWQPTPRQRPYLIPIGIMPGDKWTGMLTRDTGSWNPALSGYIQTLLASMYVPDGRWTLDLDPDRQPVLRLRFFYSGIGGGDIIVDPVAPGVDFTVSYDAGQSANVIFGQGRSVAGEGFSGMRITNDGIHTFYEPLHIWPTVNQETLGYDETAMRREVLLQVTPGLTLSEAEKVGLAHSAAFNDPGYTGSITLSADVMNHDNAVVNRFLIRPGMTLHLTEVVPGDPNISGASKGIQFMISTVSHSFEAGTTTLTLDSKYRDALTVQEVRARGRDSMAVSRALIGGQYQPPIPDQLMPWNYAEGSGVIPGGHFKKDKTSWSNYNAIPLFREMPYDIEFPWEEWTTKHPPNDPKWRDYYIHIPPKQTNADHNWANQNRGVPGQPFCFPVRMAQAGTIRLTQMAAYDGLGRRIGVPFHMSVYQNNSTIVQDMPKIPTAAYIRPGTGYAVGQRDAFMQDAWETYREDGTTISTEETVAVASVGLVRAFGTGYVPAGYWPGEKRLGSPCTGMLVDEGTWEFNTMGYDRQTSIDPYKPETQQVLSQDLGCLYVMVFCESPQDVFFIGRFYRQEPGSVV